MIDRIWLFSTHFIILWLFKVKCSNILNEIRLDTSYKHGTSIEIDLLNPSSIYYSHGLTIIKTGYTTTFEFDNHINFGREVTVIFGNQKVCILPYARNLKFTTTQNNTTYTVLLEYDLDGTHINRKYEEDTTLFYGNRTFIPVKDFISDEGSTSDVLKSTLDYIKEIGSDLSNIKERFATTISDLNIFQASDDCVTGHPLPIEIHESIQNLNYNSCSSHLITVENTNGIWCRLTFNDVKLELSKFASKFEIFYSRVQDELYNFVIASKLNKIWVEQYYSFDKTKLKFEPLYDYTFFNDLQLLSSGKEETINIVVDDVNGFILDVDEFNGNDNITRNVHKNCNIFKINGKVNVQSIKLKDIIYEIPNDSEFFMLSKCTIGHVINVSLMLRNGVVYENKTWTNVSGTIYSERINMEDNARLKFIIDMFPYLYPHLDLNNMPQVLCLSQFIPSNDVSKMAYCKDLSSLDQFEVLSSVDYF